MCKVAGVALRALYVLLNLKIIYANLDCNILQDEKYPIISNDFKISIKDFSQKVLFCRSFYCSPSQDPIKLIIGNYSQNKTYSTQIYSETHITSLSKDCGHCNSTNNSSCVKCPIIPEARNIEVHIRISNPTEDNVNNTRCIFDDFFNMTIYRIKHDKIVYCKDGVNISIPKEESCYLNATSIEQACIKPSCFNGIKEEKLSTGNIQHQFPPSTVKEACIFKINTDRKPVDIYFSPSIKHHLVIYGDDLSTPSISLASCEFSNKVSLNETSKYFHILYKNEDHLRSKGSLNIKLQDNKLCEQNPAIQNGEVMLHENIYTFSCKDGFTLEGKNYLLCEELFWNEMPRCMLDAQISTTSVSPVGYPFPLAFESHQPPLVVHHLPTNKTSPNLAQTTKTVETMDHNSSVTFQIDQTSTETTSYLTESDLEISGNFEVSTESDEDYSETSYINNNTLTNTSSDYDLKFFQLPSFKENMLLFIGVGVGILLIIIITIICAIVFKKDRCRSGVGRKFDTFQNPIYEKPVQVPMAASTEDKIELETNDNNWD